MPNPLKLNADSNDTFLCTPQDDAAPLPKEKKARKPKPPTKAQRWSDAASRAVAALEELEEMRSDWATTYDNMPQSLQSSPYGEKLGAMNDLDIQSALDAAQEAEGMDVPLGFGRD